MIRLINCKSCMQNKHDECLDEENCLCAVETKHNAATLREGVKLDKDKPVDENFYQDVKEVNEEIKHETKCYENEDFDLVADLIQSDYHFDTERETEKLFFYIYELIFGSFL